MRAIVEEGLLIPARLAFDCFVFVLVLVLFGLGRLRFLSCELCDRSKISVSDLPARLRDSLVSYK